MFELIGLAIARPAHPDRATVSQSASTGNKGTRAASGLRHRRGGPANVLTLSCKTRLTCLPREAARRLPRLTRSGRSELPAGVTRAGSSRRPRRLAAGPTDRRFLSACEGSWAAILRCSERDVRTDDRKVTCIAALLKEAFDRSLPEF